MFVYFFILKQMSLNPLKNKGLKTEKTAKLSYMFSYMF